MRGGSRSSRTCGGMRWTRNAQRRARMKRTAKSCGPDAAVLASSCAGSSFSRGDGGKRAVHRGEHEVSRKAIAQGRPECSPLNLYARVRVLLRNLHTRPRVQRAPGLPCALYFREGQDFEQTSGAIGAARSRMCVCRRMGGAKRYPSLHPPALMGIASLHPSYWIAVARDACAQRPQEGLLTKQTRTYSSRNVDFAVQHSL